MKFKQKFIGWLGSAVIATTAISAIASCSFRRHPAGEYDLPTVEFVGPSYEISPNQEGENSAVLAFEVSRELYDGEEVEPIITPIEETNGLHQIVGDLQYKSGQKQMSLTIQMNVEGEEYNNILQKFTVAFQFKYEGKKQGEPVAIASPFTFNYMARWQHVDVIDKRSSPTTPYKTDEQKDRKFEITDFFLSRKLRSTAEGYDETVEITSDNTNVVVLQNQININEEGLSIPMQVVSCSKYDQYNDSFNLTFTFRYHGVVKQTEQISNIKVQYDRSILTNALNKSDDFNGVFKGLPGETSIVSGDGIFYLNRELRSIYNENLSITLADAKITATGSTHTYTKEDFHVSIEKIDGAEVSFNFKLDVASGDEYREIQVTEIKIDWSIEDNQFECGKGQITDLEFDYVPTLKDNNVVTNYSKDKVNDLTGNAGENGVSIVSCEEEGGELGDYWFYFESSLDDDVEFTMQAVPTTDGKEFDYPIKVESINYVNDESDNQCINFTIKFENIVDTTKDQNQEFKLLYTFKKGSATPIVHESEQTFNLKYIGVEPVVETKYVPALATSYTGVNHGDTIIHVVGSLNPALSGGDSIKTVEIDPEKTTDRPIEFIEGQEGDYKEGYYIHDNVIDMYVKITANLSTEAHLKHEYPTKFKFTFWNPSTGTEYQSITKQTTIIYEPFATDLESYIIARTVPLNMKYKGSSGYDRFFGTSFILSKAPEDETNAIDPNGYTYYVASNTGFRDKFDYWCANYSARTEFSFGITDERFKSTYNYNTDEDVYTESRTTWQACDYRHDYVYCDTDSMVWEDANQFKWIEDGQVSTYGLDMQVAKVNFSDLMYIQEGQGQIDDEKVIAYVNKLNTLNNYYKTYGHINNMLNAPIKESEMNQYSGFAMGGFPYQQHYISENWTGGHEGLMSRTGWEFKEFGGDTGISLRYQSSDDYKTSGRGNSEYIDSAKTMTRGSPVYYPSTSIAKKYDEHGLHSFAGYSWVSDAYTFAGDESMYGGMLAARSSTVDPKTGKHMIYLIGIYRNSYDDLNTYDADNEYYKNRFPYFDSFIDDDSNRSTKPNLLAQFWEPKV